MFTWLRNWGVNKAIDSLDLLDGVLAQKIEDAKKEVQKMDSQQMAVYLIDQVQDALRQHFKIPPPDLPK